MKILRGIVLPTLATVPLKCNSHGDSPISHSDHEKGKLPSGPLRNGWMKVGPSGFEPGKTDPFCRKSSIIEDRTIPGSSSACQLFDQLGKLLSLLVPVEVFLHVSPTRQTHRSASRGVT